MYHSCSSEYMQFVKVSLVLSVTTKASKWFVLGW